MAFPTLFRIIVDLIGISAGAIMNQPHVSAHQAEDLEAQSCRHNRPAGSMFYTSNELKALRAHYWDLFNRSNVDNLDKGLSAIIQRELRFNNFYYAEKFFKKYFPNLK